MYELDGPIALAETQQGVIFGFFIGETNSAVLFLILEHFPFIFRRVVLFVSVDIIDSDASVP